MNTGAGGTGGTGGLLLGLDGMNRVGIAPRA